MIPPYSPAILRELLRRHGLTGSQAARMMAVDSRAVRKWCSPEDRSTHRDIPRNAWLLLLLLTGESTIKDVLSAINSESN